MKRSNNNNYEEITPVEPDFSRLRGNGYDNYEQPDEPKQKTSLFRRFINFVASKAVKPDNDSDPRENGKSSQNRENGFDEQSPEVRAFLQNLEHQLGDIDEQNRLLLEHLSIIKDNNNVLMEQVKVLTANNDLLYEQFQASRKREKASKIIAIISSALAIGFTLWRIIDAMISNGVFNAP